MNKPALAVAVFAAVISTILYSSTCHGADLGLDALKTQFLPAEFRNKNFSLDDLKKVYREKCKRATGIYNSTLYAEIEKGIMVFKDCVSDLVNVTAIQEEIEEARPIGELDTVFAKYCSKAPGLDECFKDFNYQIQPCLTMEERKQNAAVIRIGSSLINFMCMKGGDQIALFVAEDGPECLEANKEALSACANQSFAELIPQNGSLFDLLNAPELVLKPQHCIDLDKFQTCAVHHLEQCQEITPANVVDSVLKFIKNETTCTTYLMDAARPKSVMRKTSGAGWRPVVSALALTLSLLMASLA